MRRATNKKKVKKGAKKILIHTNGSIFVDYCLTCIRDELGYPQIPSDPVMSNSSIKDYRLNPGLI
jgi:hypothetical protein